MTTSHPTVAVVGATGAVGTTMLSILEEREFPTAGLRLFASERSGNWQLWRVPAAGSGSNRPRSW